jgi:hypothetical protein
MNSGLNLLKLYNSHSFNSEQGWLSTRKAGLHWPGMSEAHVRFRDRKPEHILLQALHALHSEKELHAPDEQ